MTAQPTEEGRLWRQRGMGTTRPACDRPSDLGFAWLAETLRAVPRTIVFVTYDVEEALVEDRVLLWSNFTVTRARDRAP